MHSVRVGRLRSVRCLPSAARHSPSRYVAISGFPWLQLIAVIGCECDNHLVCDLDGRRCVGARSTCSLWTWQPRSHSSAPTTSGETQHKKASLLWSFFAFRALLWLAVACCALLWMLLAGLLLPHKNAFCSGALMMWLAVESLLSGL